MKTINKREKAEAFDVLKKVIDAGIIIPVSMKNGKEFYLAMPEEILANPKKRVIRIKRKEWESLIIALYS